MHDFIANAGGFDDRRSGLATLINDRDVILIAVHDVERGIAGIDRNCALEPLAARNSGDWTVDILPSNESRSDRWDEHFGLDLAETLICRRVGVAGC